MKTFSICIAMLCLLATGSTAQIASTDSFIPSEFSPITTLNLVPVENLELEAMIAEKHTDSAEKQLKNYLAHSLKYSEILVENSVEGKVMVVVNIAADATIGSFTILESPHAEITKMVEEALENLKAISFKDQWYRGEGQLEIPLNFSLR